MISQLRKPAASLLLAATTVGALLHPLASRAVEAAQFSDTQEHWAEKYISTLSDQGVLGGFPDGSFRPDQPVTRAQFAAIVDHAFRLSGGQAARSFRDVPRSYWAARAIGDASASGLVAGFPDGNFRPDEAVTRAQALTVFARGISAPQADLAILDQYRDSGTIPGWAQQALASASEAQLVVNYPTPDRLLPNRPATRADVAAFTYQALASQGRVAPIEAAFAPGTSTLQAGTVIATIYDGDETLFIAPGETRAFNLQVSGVKGRESGGSLPYGSQVHGKFVKAPGGTRFIADSVTIAQRIYRFDARSQILKDTKDPRESGFGAMAGDAALGAAAGSLIGGVTGNRDMLDPVKLGAGAVLGVLVGNVTAPQVVRIEPDQSIELTLTADAPLR